MKRLRLLLCSPPSNFSLELLQLELKINRSLSRLPHNQSWTVFSKCHQIPFTVFRSKTPTFYFKKKKKKKKTDTSPLDLNQGSQSIELYNILIHGFILKM